jgi:L-xylulokinase
MDARKLVEDLASSTAGANGLLFIPFIYGAPQYRGASAALLGQKGHHRAADVSRALAEGVTQYHRVQLQQLGHQGIALSSEPWTLAGGGARNPVWAQIFANILGHPVKRHLEQELGSRGVAALAFSGTGGDLKRWKLAESRAAITEPDEDRAIYEDQVEFFDQALQALQPLWSARVAK